MEILATQRLDRQRVGTLRYSGPPPPVPLPERPAEGKLRTDSTYDWREIGEQVTGYRRAIAATRCHIPRHRLISGYRV